MQKSGYNDHQVASKGDFLIYLASGGKSYVGEDLQRMYQRWTVLSDVRKWELNKGMHEILDGNKRILYCQMIESFKLWDILQTQRGAPGWSGDVPSDPPLDAEIFNLLYTMDLVWRMRLQDEFSSVQDNKTNTATPTKTNDYDVGSIDILTEDRDSDISPVLSGGDAHEIKEVD